MMTYLVCLLLLLSSVAAIDISFSRSTYYGKVATLEDKIGKVVIETQLVYNESLVQNFTTKDYTLYRTDRVYFSVDKNGIVTLKKKLPYRRTYIFQISLFYTVMLTDNTNDSKFLTADVRVQAIGPVHFDNTTYRITIPTSYQPNDEVYDFSQHVVFNKSAFRNVYIEFDYVYSSYFSIDPSLGVLYVRRALYPTSFSVRIEIEYDVTLKNGTIVSDDEYVYASIIAIGCRGAEEIKAFWPETYPCSAFRVPCADLDSGNYFTNGSATRVCNSEGEWLPPDYSTCSVKAKVGSFALIWMTFSTSSGSYVLRYLARIRSDIEDLFPKDGVSDISPVSAFRSNAQYGFMIGFKMNVKSSTVNESDIANAQRLLNRAYRFGSLYLRSSRTIQGRGLRFFKGIDSKCGLPETTDAKYLEVCSGESCNCTNTAINDDGSCDSIKLRDEEPTSIPRNKTEPSYLSLNASDYYGDISAFSPKGTYILTVGYNITGKSVANITNFHYDLSGYYSDFFKIDRRQGHLTVNRQLASRTYSFDVSFFYNVTYTNRTTAYNYTESDIFITAYAGVGFNASSYYVTVDANYTINQTVLTTMKNFLKFDPTFTLKSMTFYYISDTRFFIDSTTGDIKIQRHLDPLRYHYARVYLRYNGTINTTKKFYDARISTLVRIYTKGCFELENGNVVWPASHVCTTAVHNCYDVDHAFNNGTVTRYCSSTGRWQDPDYSQCFLIPGTKPFVHLYLTFYTYSYSHVRNNLQNIVSSGNSLLSRLNVSDLSVYSLKRSVVRYGMVVVLRGEATPNNEILTSINSTIYQFRTFARVRLQTTGNGIVGFNTSSQCEYPTYPSNAWNSTTFTAVCQKGDNVSCDCETRSPTVGICDTTNTNSTPPIVTPTTPTPVGLNVSAASVSNTSIGLQWYDDTSGITNFKVQYSAVIRYSTTNGEATYVDTDEITTTNTSYMFTLLNPSTDYTFTVISYTEDGESSSTTLSQTTMEGRKENPSFVELLFTSKQDCTKWGKDSELIKKVVDSMVTNIASFCTCRYTREYIKVWRVNCQQSLDDDTSKIVLIAQLMPTNLYDASYMMQAMSDWVTSSGTPGMDINGELIRVDQNCKVQIDHPYGRDCSEVAPANTGAQNQFSTDNDDDDDNSAGAAVGGVVAGLVIICVTIVVLVVVVMLLRRREKKQSSQKPEIPSSSYSADTMKVQLSDDF